MPVIPSQRRAVKSPEPVAAKVAEASSLGECKNVISLVYIFFSKYKNHITVKTKQTKTRC